MNTSHSQSTQKTGSLAVLGTVQIVAGAFYLLISALGTAALIAVGYEASTLISRLNLRNAVEAFMILQVFAGWILGPFTIWAGVRMRRGASRKSIWRIAVANLFYFPIGTTIGALALVEMNRPEIKYRFAD